MGAFRDRLPAMASSEEIVRAARVARRFHEVYGGLAGDFGHEGAGSWEAAPDQYKLFMVATVRTLMNEGAL